MKRLLGFSHLSPLFLHAWFALNVKKNTFSKRKLMRILLVDVFYTGWPPKKIGTVNFLGLYSDQQLSFFSLLDRAGLFLIFSIITSRSSNLVEILFLLWVISYGLIFGICHSFVILSCLGTLEIGEISKWQFYKQITHKIKSSQPNLRILV